MKYVTKYLPVEGEIKEGETGISINNATYTHFNHLGKNYGKPAKLFLCSRDIQVGDKFQQQPASFPAYISTCIEVKDDFVKCDEERLWASHTVFKVIGEISPEAKWVKEGDEFNEENIKKGWVRSGMTIFNYSEKFSDNKSPYSYDVLIYKIKGPCGHFH